MAITDQSGLARGVHAVPGGVVAPVGQRQRAGLGKFARVVLAVLTCGVLGACSEASPPRATTLGASEPVMAPDDVPVRSFEPRWRPVAASVALSGTPRVGQSVWGTYRWMADLPETDSVHQWEAAYQPTRIRVIGRKPELLPSAGLRGVRIRYCVKPAVGHGADRLAGHKTCSAWTTVDGTAPPQQASRAG